MKLGTILTLFMAALGGVAVVATASPTGVHSEKFECTRCHTKTPAEGDTLEQAPLVQPIKELCASCHEG